jgi:hypothetical protein
METPMNSFNNPNFTNPNPYYPNPPGINQPGQPPANFRYLPPGKKSPLARRISTALRLGIFGWGLGLAGLVGSCLFLWFDFTNDITYMYAIIAYGVLGLTATTFGIISRRQTQQIFNQNYLTPNEELDNAMKELDGALYVGSDCATAFKKTAFFRSAGIIAGILGSALSIFLIFQY